MHVLSNPARLKIPVLGLAIVLGAGVALGSGVAQAAPSAQDSAFLTSNEQVNLAEQTIGGIAGARAQNAATSELAQRTGSDHKAAQVKVSAVARALGVALPATPNATQQAQAAELKSVSAGSFDLTYAQIQVAGHQMSIAATQAEIATGSDQTVVAYAKYYLPVAQMHLQMAQALVSSLGGSPVSAPAGNAGLAAPRSDQTGWRIALGAGLLTAIGAVFVLRTRRRSIAL